MPHRALPLLLTLLLAIALPAAGEEIVLSFAGDCTLGAMPEYEHYASGFIAQVAERGFEHPFSGVLPILQADDLTLVNLEGTFTQETDAQDKAFVFKAPPDYAQILPLGSVEAVNIANNHIDDFKAEGRQDTLDAHGIAYSGGGTLSVVDVKGVRIGMTGYSFTHRLTLENLAADIAALRQDGCDIIIFSMHAGREEQHAVTGEQKTLARGAIELGADIVVGHHPHVLQGVEVYRGKPIFYSLGNFVFGGNVNPGDWDTAIGQVVLEADGDGVHLREMRIIPCLISGAHVLSDFRPVVAEGQRAADILRKVRRYSPGMPEGYLDTGVLALGAE